ncbi:hypothetical protein Sa4125_08280 [Aureimonas sp. SA4125]|uniref:BrnT family toxin n=1 Tax=Aureimonas sp. SA4125 TaxID=2826993 RepID=UPI001CC6BCEB|nr:BrnT family toxin [Aureimonas sp. SA4125]BDA83286.1 hypothetical protein Sa4125_08280 [Aureimonas sp. SA4125]
MSLDFAGFEWDAGNIEKCAKHGVSREEIETVLSGEPALREDPFDRAVERRLRAIGRTPAGRYIFVVFTFRQSVGHWRIRPISARYMHSREAGHYEQS